MSHKFLLFGMGVGQNYGCDAIVIGTERILRNSFPDCEMWLTREQSWRRKPDYKAILGESSLTQIKGEWQDTRPALLGKGILARLGLLERPVIRFPQKIIKACDCVLSVGGDLYTFADKEKDWPFPFPIVEAGDRIMQQGKPYVIWCASVGPLEKAGDRLEEIVNHLKSCRAIIVREQMSFSYLQETLGLKDNVYLAADPAFVMDPEPFDFPFLEEGGDKVLAINFSLGLMRHVLGNISQEAAQSKCEALVCDLLDVLPIKALLVPHVQTDYGLLIPMYETLRKKYSERVAILPSGLGTTKTKWAVSRSNALLTMRFHCSLAGFSTMTPTMTLVSTSKGTKMCKEMYGDLEYALNIKDMNTDAAIRKAKSLLENEEEIRARITPACEKMKGLAFSAGEILAKVL